MTNAKNVYALMLALVIVLSGCFGNTTPETDAQDSDDADEYPYDGVCFLARKAPVDISAE